MSDTTILENHLKQIKIPSNSTEVFKDECAYCFATQESEGGLHICLNTFQGLCKDHVRLHHMKTGNSVFLNIQRRRIEAPPKAVSTSEPKPTVLGIGVAGGFEVSELKEVTFEDTYSLFVLPEGKSISLPNINIPYKVQQSVDGVIAAESASRKTEIAAWQDDQVKPSIYADKLVQINAGLKIPGAGWKCSSCDFRENLWLCLTCGSIGCGRRQYDGSGGNNHGSEHSEQTGHPLAVKLGTITPEGNADVYSYPEGNLVSDPKLKEHLAHFGINIADMQKTDKSMAELELDQNIKLDLNRIQEEGKALVPLFGPGFTGINNLGNTCYMASVMQVLFTLPEFKQRYFDGNSRIFNTSQGLPALDLNVQLAKFAHGLLSGEYSQPKKASEVQEPSAAASSASSSASSSTASSSETAKKAEEVQEGITPKMFKYVVGKGHPEFSGMAQQDALEFFQYLMQVVQRGSRASAALVDDASYHFKYKVEEKTFCTESERCSFTHREDNIISLPVPLEAAINKAEVEAYNAQMKAIEDQEKAGVDVKKEKAKIPAVRPRIPLRDCLDAFTQGEIVEGYYSAFLKKRTNAIKTTRLATFPDYLVIQIRKFYLDGWVPKKLDVYIDVDDVIDVSSLRAAGPLPSDKMQPAADDEEAAAEPFINPEIISTLTSMGFPEIRAKRAALAVKNSDAEAAMNWLFGHMDDPDIDAPLDLGQKQKTKKSDAGATSTISEESIDLVMGMGFARKQAVKALKNTDGNVERAVDWLFSHPDDLDMDEDVPAAAAPAAAATSDAKPEFADGNGRYELVGFISHIGTSTSCGHYVCHIKKDGKWVLFNDRKVAVSEEPPKDSGYLYFFKRL